MTPEIAFRAAVLENFHTDPADRIIVSTCMHHGATLVTKDRTIIKSDKIKTIW